MTVEGEGFGALIFLDGAIQFCVGFDQRRRHGERIVKVGERGGFWERGSVKRMTLWRISVQLIGVAGSLCGKFCGVNSFLIEHRLQLRLAAFCRNVFPE